MRRPFTSYYFRTSITNPSAAVRSCVRRPFASTINNQLRTAVSPHSLIPNIRCTLTVQNGRFPHPLTEICWEYGRSPFNHSVGLRAVYIILLPHFNHQSISSGTFVRETAVLTINSQQSTSNYKRPFLPIR
ncbi:MAG: hypothetical protein GY943_04845 [Chloroflexi bacterium]|nr:hypothetical protein [Chloroflexota bacterium]